jgi:CheY-like chemotaxis protein
VETAVDGEDGLRRARQLGPDVMTLDVMMPRVDGWAVLTALEVDPSGADIPVILLTVVDNKNLGVALGGGRIPEQAGRSGAARAHCGPLSTTS